MDLTKSAKRSIAVIYKTYEKRHKSGMSKDDAVYFRNLSEDLQKIEDQISDDIQELKSAGLISPDVIGGFELNNSAIIYMENRTAETIKEWLSFGTQFIP